MLLTQNSLSGVDDLIKKHDGFAKTLEAQEEKIDTLEQLAQALLAQEHYASDHIRSRCQGVLDRRDKVKQVMIGFGAFSQYFLFLVFMKYFAVCYSGNRNKIALV